MDILPFHISKSHAAFLLTCNKLFRDFSRVYFWTFTFKSVYHDWEYCYLWNGFMRSLQHYYGDMLFGVRVIEPHKTHGLHYHALFNQRIPQGLVHRLGEPYGIGRVYVKRVEDKVGAAWYLGKYLTKSKCRLYKGIHKWATVGGYTGVKVKDIVIDSPSARNQRLVAACMGKLPYHLASLFYAWSNAYGELHEWGYREKRNFMLRVSKLSGVESWFMHVYEVVIKGVRTKADMFKEVKRVYSLDYSRRCDNIVSSRGASNPSTEERKEVKYENSHYAGGF